MLYKMICKGTEYWYCPHKSEVYQWRNGLIKRKKLRVKT